jgi:OOP family OmpA-OmpF porin
MRSTFTRTQATLAAACAIALGVFSATSNAQVRDVNETALLLDTRGAPVMNATGLCWHTAYGPSPMSTSGCHAEGSAQVAQYVTPAALLPAYEKVAFEANILFDSSESVLTAAGRTTLDAFVGKLSGLDTQSVRAIGYADRMGSEAFNQILSEERVDAVKSYLVKKGVAADRVRTSAWGETRPSTAAGECKDANNPKNVACMQPDRHVSIEISGSRLAK